MGDGANDLPMMGEAGLSVAYHAKPKVREQAMVAINSGGLDRLLDVLGGLGGGVFQQPAKRSSDYQKATLAPTILKAMLNKSPRSD
jgi:hypothetical protein